MACGNLRENKVEPILELCHINKSFSGIQVLFDIDLTVNKGEIVCLAGENGAGKSTLIKILSGAESPDSGKIIIHGKSYTRMMPSQAMELGIATIYQDIDLVDTLTVADNIFLNAEIRKTNRLFVDKQAQELKTKILLDSLNISIPADAEVSSLSQGQKQNLQIAKALYRKADILILDEPTASLGEEETKALIQLVKKLKAEGVSIIYISHYLDEIFTLGDKVVVLKDGHLISTRRIADTTTELLIHDMVGRDTSGQYVRRQRYDTHDKALKIMHYSRSTVVRDISLEISHGEILGIGGLVGSGRTEFARLLFGADKRDSGSMLFSGEDITPENPYEAIRNGICFISEDRKIDGLFLSRSMKENISIVKNNRHAIALNLKQEANDVQTYIDGLKIKTFGQQQEVENLSGGNQQKIAIARWLYENGDIYIFDEPSKGVDVGAREQIYELMEMLARQNKIIIMISSTMTELTAMSDRIAVFRDGKLAAIFKTDNFNEHDLLKAYIGSN